MRTLGSSVALVAGIAVVVLLTSFLPLAGAARGAPAGSSGQLRAGPHLPVFSGVLTINPDGSLSSPAAPVTISGNTYTWTATMNGSVVDERNSSVLNGNGHNLNYTVGPAAIALVNVHQVTVQNFRITNASSGGVAVEAGSDISVVGNHISGSGRAIASLGTTGLNVSSNLAPMTGGIAVLQGSGIRMYLNNVSMGPGSGFDIENSLGVTLGNNSATLTGAGAVVLVADSNVLLWGNVLNHANGDCIYLWQVDHAWLQENVALHCAAEAVYSGSSSTVTLAYNDFRFAVYENVYIDTIQGLTIDHNRLAYAGYEGIYLYHVSAFSVTNNDLTRDGYEGLYSDYVANGVIQGNNASFFRYEGFGVGESTNVTLANNTASYDQYSNGEGFYLYADSHSAVTSNTALNAGFGIDLEESNWVTVSNNVFSYANGSGYGVYLYANTQVSITNNDASHAGLYGLYSDYDSAVTVWGLDARYSGFAGVYSYDGTGNTFVGVQATHATAYGVYSYGANRLTLANIRAGSGSPAAEGFFLDQVTASTLTNGTALGGLVGVQLSYVVGVRVAGGNFSSANTGALLTSNAQTMLQGNTFWNDNVSFSSQNSSASVVLFQNNFVSDRSYRLAFATPGLEPHFDQGYPAGGNFWSNHTGPDAQNGPGQNLSGADGIVDNAVRLDRASFDHYPLAHAWAPHTVTFVASQLPVGASWGVTFNGVTQATNTASVTFNESNAATSAYTYAVTPIPGWVASPWGGSGTYQQQDLTIPVSFSTFNYAVTIHAPSVPATVPWSVVVGGVTHSATGPTLVFTEPNQSYSLAVHPPVGFVAGVNPPTLTVAGAAVSLTLNLTAITYAVTFTETGLPGSTTWSVTLAGQTQTSSTSTITFLEPNGTYTYSVARSGGASAHPGGGQLAVQGSPMALPVSFGPAASAAGTGIYSAASVDGLLALVVVLAILAVVGLLLAARARRRPPSTGPVPAYAGPGGGQMSPTSPSAGGVPPGAGQPPAWSEEK